MYCECCEKYKSKKIKLLESDESVFDIAYDLQDFIDQCKKTCIEKDDPLDNNS